MLLSIILKLLCCLGDYTIPFYVLLVLSAVFGLSARGVIGRSFSTGGVRGRGYRIIGMINNYTIVDIIILS